MPSWLKIFFRIDWGKVLRIALPVVLIIGAVWYIYSLGSRHGEALIQSRWDRAKLEQKEAAEELQAKYDDLHEIHTKEGNLINDQLSEINKAHAVAIATLNAEWAERLRLSKERADIYFRQSQGGSAECSSLAGHAAKLDGSLEQGIRLVKEFQSTLEQRDGQLKALGDQIQADRKILENIGEGNGSN